MRSKHVVYVAIGVVIGVLLSAGTMVLAGTLDPTSGPTDPASQMYTLEQIYARLTIGAAGTQMTTFTEPSDGPGTGTMHTLNDVMAAAPAVQTNAATPAEVVSGSVVWGLSEGDWGMIEGTRPYFPIVKTGVTLCYKSASPWTTCECGTTDCPAGQDGALQMGIAPIESRFTVIGGSEGGTVLDNMTGLIWLRNANCPASNLTWAQAFEYVTELNTSGTMRSNACGDFSNGGSHQTDWRVPNVNELQSLNDFGHYNPSLPDGYPFLLVEPQWYWTSTPHSGGLEYHMSRALYVSMYGGRVFHELKDRNVGDDPDWNNLFVWPVRGGQQ